MCGGGVDKCDSAVLGGPRQIIVMQRFNYISPWLYLAPKNNHLHFEFTRLNFSRETLYSVAKKKPRKSEAK